MFFYLIVIAVSVMLYKFAERSGKLWLFVVAMMPPVLIEGLRDHMIGTDMQTYTEPYFDTLKTASSVIEVPELINHSDYGYLYLTYFCAKYLGSFNVFLTICAIIKLVPIYITAYLQRKNLNSLLFVFFYYTYYYILGFSMMRQSLAISFCFLSLNYFFDKKYIKFICWIIVAYYMHNSAILMVYLPMMSLIGKIRYRYIISIFIPLFIFLHISDIMEAFINSPLFTAGKVEYYMDSGVASEKTSILIALFLGGIGCITLIKKRYMDDVFLLLSSIAYTLIFLFLASYIEVAFRMSYYMTNVALLMTLRIMKKERSLLYNLGLFAVFMLHFAIACSHGLNDTIPYRSLILGIGY